MSGPTLGPFDAILFDLDGTLIDSVGAVIRAWTQLCREFPIDPVELSKLHGVPAKSVVARLLPPELREVALARIEELEVGDTEGVVILPGTLEILTSLTDAGAPWAIATSCTRPLFEARRIKVSLPTPPVVVTADQTTRGKPDPDPYLVAAQRLGVDPTRCLVVEDAPAGLQAGRSAGCATMAVGQTVDREELLASGQADLIVPSLAAVEIHVDAEGIWVRARELAA